MKRSRSISASQGTQLVRSGTASSYGSKRSRTSSKSRKTFGAVGPAKYSGFGFPPKIQVKHRYVEAIGLAAVAGGVSTQLFRCNGMFDPNYSGTGHQPLYFDQLSAVYDHFTVLKSYLKLTVSTTSTTPQIVTCFINDDTTVTPSGIEARMEQSSAKSVQITAGEGPKTMYISWDAYKTFGGSILGNDNLQGSAAADPTEQSLFTISAQCASFDTATTVIGTAEIVYVAVWDEIRDIASS